MLHLYSQIEMIIIEYIYNVLDSKNSCYVLKIHHSVSFTNCLVVGGGGREGSTFNDGII